MRRDVGGDPLAQDILLQRDPVQLDVRIGGLELGRQALHHDHVGVVHRRDRQSRRSLGRNRQRWQSENQPEAQECPSI
jgi:hypothetical protein